MPNLVFQRMKDQNFQPITCSRTQNNTDPTFSIQLSTQLPQFLSQPCKLYKKLNKNFARFIFFKSKFPINPVSLINSLNFLNNHTDYLISLTINYSETRKIYRFQTNPQLWKKKKNLIFKKVD